MKSSEPLFSCEAWKDLHLKTEHLWVEFEIHKTYKRNSSITCRFETKHLQHLSKNTIFPQAESPFPVTLHRSLENLPSERAMFGPPWLMHLRLDRQMISVIQKELLFGILDIVDIHIFFKHSDHPHLINMYIYVGGKSWSILTYVPCFSSWLLQTTLMAAYGCRGSQLVFTRDILKIWSSCNSRGFLTFSVDLLSFWRKMLQTWKLP